MVIDTSAIAAILFDEPERTRFVRAIDGAAVRLLSAASLVEATLVVEGRKGPRAERLVDRFVEDGEIEVVPLTAEHAALACEAFRKYGRGRHVAALNLGDCFTYALAKATGDRLLFTGEDFARTDLVSVF
jgi:ribonuclease VapC